MGRSTLAAAVLLPLALGAPVRVGVQAAPPPATPELGARLPPITIDGLRQTEARSFAEFYGRAVLIEFFAYWSRTSPAQVAPLNELEDAFGPRGLSVVAVTREAPAKTVPWVEQQGARYAYGFDVSGELSRMFEVDQLPFAVLVDARGTLVWSGHPARLRPADVERALDGALERPVWRWPAHTRALAGRLQRGEFAAALREARELAPEDGFDPPAFVQGRIDALVRRFEDLLAGGDPGAAFLFGRELRTDLAALPEGARLAARLDELSADPAVRGEIDAAERMLALERRFRRVRGEKPARELRAEVAAFVEAHRVPRVEARARELLERLDRLLEKPVEKAEDP